MNCILPPSVETMIVSRINISPFSYQSLDQVFEPSEQISNIQTIENHLRNFLGKEYVLTKSGRHAIELVLADADLKPDDVITIFTSLGTNYVSSCVTNAIEEYCRWSMNIEKDTKMVLVIHEWGIPHPRIKEICALGFPVIEDCAYAFASKNDYGRLGNYGRYAIYSLPKFFEINFGGIVCGLSSSKDLLLQEHINYIYASIGKQLLNIEKINSKRIANWNILKELFLSVGAEPFFELKGGIVPGVFMFRPDSKLNLQDIKVQYNAYGIESTIYYGSNAFYIPCNQSLNLGSLQYLFNIYKSML